MRILTLDIETSPAIAYVWGLHKVYVAPSQVIQPTRVLCFAAKWTDEKRIVYRSEFHHGPDEMLDTLWNLLDEADAVVHYNGTSFDIPHIQREFLLAGLMPPSPYVQIDLWRTVRSQFRFLSNKLDSVAQALELGGKAAHEGFGLWEKCLAGDKAAWSRMQKYNVQDVRLTESLYLNLRPWIKSHPNVNLVTGATHSCPRCGSLELHKRGLVRSKVSSFQQWQCLSCGGYSRSQRRLDGVDLRNV